MSAAPARPTTGPDRGAIVLISVGSVLGLLAVGLELLLRMSTAGISETVTVALAAISLLFLALAVARSFQMRISAEPPPIARCFRLLGIGSVFAFLGSAVFVVVHYLFGREAGFLVMAVTIVLAAPMIFAGAAGLSWPGELGRRQTTIVLADTAMGAFGLAVIFSFGLLPRLSDLPVASGWPVTISAWGMWLLGVGMLLMAAALRRRAALPFDQILLLHVSIGAQVVGVLMELMGGSTATAAVTLSLFTAVISALVLVVLAGRPGDTVETRSVRRIRRWYAMVVPLLPLPVASVLLVGLLADEPQGQQEVTALGGLLLLALLTGVVVLRGLASAELNQAALRRSVDDFNRGMQQRWFQALVGRTQDLVLVLDPTGRIAYATPSVDRLTGLDAQEIQGMPMSALLSPRADGSSNDAVINGQLAAAEAAHGEPTDPLDLVLRAVDGDLREVEWQFTVPAGLDFDGVLAHGTDVTEDRRMRALLRESVTHDPLTGLLSREGFLNAPDLQLGQCVLLIDVFQFGQVNDRFGHDAGDEVLVAIGRTLQNLSESTRSLARLSGDAFALIIGGPAPQLEVVSTVARLRESLRQLELPNRNALSLAMAAGYAVAEQDATTVAELLSRAELALSRSQTLDRLPLIRYDQDLRMAQDQAAEVEANLRSALRDRDLFVLFQPIVRLSDNSVVSVEALVRRRRADGSLESPDTFIPLAEQLGLVDEVDYAVLTRALTDLDWVSHEVGRRIPVSVNVSATELDEGLQQRISDVLAETGWRARDLTVEITETAVASHLPRAQTVLRGLQKMGCQIALDDFGTGYSAMASLAELPLDVLKIDASFARRLASGERGVAMMRALVEIGRSLGLTTVAEGLTTVEQADLLRGMGCQRGQGYLYAEPLTSAALVDFLQPDGATIVLD